MKKRCFVPFEMTQKLEVHAEIQRGKSFAWVAAVFIKTGLWEVAGERRGQKRSSMSLLHLSPELLIQQGSSRRSQAICCDGSAFLVKCQMEIEPVWFCQRIQLSNP